MTWSPLPADTDLTRATAYRHLHDATAGTWHLLPDGTVVHRTVDGNLQRSLHDATALTDLERFAPVQP